MKRLIALSLALAATFSASAADAKAILTEIPKHCYTFDTWTTNVISGFGDYIKNSTGVSALSFSYTRSGKVRLSPRGGALWNDPDTKNKGEGPFGGGLALGSGDWTYYCRVKPISIKDGVLFCVGGHAGTATALSLLQNEDRGVSLVTTKGKALVTGSRTDIAVAGAVGKYHDYAIVFDATEKIAYLYVDGVLGGQLAHPNYNAANKDWQWGSISGGLGTTSYQFGADCDFEEFRFYQRKLTTEELVYLRDYTVKPVGHEFKDRAFTLPANQTLYLDATGKTLKTGDVVFTAVGGITLEGAVEIEGGTVEVSADRTKLIYKQDVSDIVSAHWTGLGGDGDGTNPANWACTNSAGQAVVGALPGKETSLYIPGPLTTNLDWTALGAVKFGEGMIDLNGQRLAVASIAETPAEIETLITNAVEGAGDIFIATGTTKLFTNLVLRAGVTVTVGGGATLDENGVYDMPLGVRLENGATLTNTGDPQGYTKAQFMGGLQVADGATAYIDTPNQFAFTGKGYATMPIALGTGTLVKRGKGKVSFQNAAIVGTGTIRLEEGEINLGNKGLSIADDITVEIRDNTGTDTYLWIEVTCAIPRLAGDGRIAASKASLTVTKYFSGRLKLGQKGGGNQFNNGTLTFGDTMTLDLAGVNGTWTQHKKMVYASNATVFADLAGRTVAEGDKIIDWSAMPSVTSRILGRGRSPSAPLYFVRRADGLYASRTAMIFVR